MLATGDQRRKLNAMVQEIAKYTGHDFAEVKMFAKERAMKRGYPFAQDERGPLYLPDGEVMPESETRISTDEASYLIDELYQIAAELGVLFHGL